jgi:hypothetical protein
MYSTILATVAFFRLFTREGDIEYTGNGNTHRPKGQSTTLLAILLRLAGGVGWESMVFTKMKA